MPQHFKWTQDALNAIGLSATGSELEVENLEKQVASMRNQLRHKQGIIAALERRLAEAQSELRRREDHLAAVCYKQAQKFAHGRPLEEVFEAAQQSCQPAGYACNEPDCCPASDNDD